MKKLRKWRKSRKNQRTNVSNYNKLSKQEEAKREQWPRIGGHDELEDNHHNKQFG